MNNRVTFTKEHIDRMEKTILSASRMNAYDAKLFFASSGGILIMQVEKAGELGRVMAC